MDGIHRALTNDFSAYVDDDSDLYGDREALLKSDITREGNSVGIQVEPDETIPKAQPLHHRAVSNQVAIQQYKKGCMTACDNFYDHFKILDEQPVKNYLPAHNAQDAVLIGYYVP